MRLSVALKKYLTKVKMTQVMNKYIVSWVKADILGTLSDSIVPVDRTGCLYDV